MSQISTDNEDNRSVAASDFVQLDQPDEMPDQQEAQHQQLQHPHFGLHQNALDWTMETGTGTGSSPHNYGNDLKEHKLLIANLEAKNQTLQAKVENLELKAEIRALKENAEQKANYQALEVKMNGFGKMLSTQTDHYQKEMAQLESKNRKLEGNLSSVELQTKGAIVLVGEMMDELKDEFSKMLSKQQKQMMAQFQAQMNSLEQKLIEAAEQRAQMEKNEFEEIIQQKMEKFRKEMGENGKQAIGVNLNKLDYVWDQLMAKGKILANPKGLVWNGLKTEVSISGHGLKATSGTFGQYIFATEGYAISGKHCRKENFPFPGTIVFYFEVTFTTAGCYGNLGFSDGKAGGFYSTNSYVIARDGGTYGYWLSGMEHKLESPIRAIDAGAVVGCGLMLNSKNELAVFFTVNGILCVKQTPINPTVDRLYPTVYVYRTFVEANFGANLIAKPFKFDVDKCPGIVFE